MVLLFHERHCVNRISKQTTPPMDLYPKISFSLQTRKQSITDDGWTHTIAKQHRIPMENKGRLANQIQWIDTIFSRTWKPSGSPSVWKGSETIPLGKLSKDGVSKTSYGARKSIESRSDQDVGKHRVWTSLIIVFLYTHTHFVEMFRYLLRMLMCTRIKLGYKK